MFNELLKKFIHRSVSDHASFVHDHNLAETSYVIVTNYACAAVKQGNCLCILSKAHLF